MVKYDDWTQKQLREACKKQGLSAGGTKADMANRLRDNDGPSEATKSPAKKANASRSRSPARSKSETKPKASKSPVKNEKSSPKKTTTKKTTTNAVTKTKTTDDDDWLLATIIVLLAYFMLVWCNILPESLAGPMKPIVCFFREKFIKNAVKMLENSPISKWFN